MTANRCAERRHTFARNQRRKRHAINVPTAPGDASSMTAPLALQQIERAVSDGRRWTEHSEAIDAGDSIEDRQPGDDKSMRCTSRLARCTHSRSRAQRRAPTPGPRVRRGRRLIALSRVSSVVANKWPDFRHRNAQLGSRSDSCGTMPGT